MTWRCGPSLCVYVHPAQRGQGIAVALLHAAVQHAGWCGAPVVEGYPCDPTAPIAAEEAFYGTVAMFTQAGFTVVRPPLPGLPKAWTPRYTMRAPCAPTRSRNWPIIISRAGTCLACFAR
jgi:hypothetical protein